MCRLQKLLVCALALLMAGMVGCRSVRYKIGDALSPEWLKSSKTRELYTQYTSNAQIYFNNGSLAKIEEQDPGKARRNFRQAELQFKKALDFNSYSFKAHLGAGSSLLNQETREKCLEAIEYLEMADDLRAGEWRVHYGLARAHQLLARMDGDLINSLESQWVRSPKGGGAQLELGARISKILGRRIQSLESAIREANLIFEFAPDQHQAYLILGTTYAELHRYDKAIPNLKTYLTMASTTRKAFLTWQQNDTRPRGVTGPEGELEKLILKNLKQDAEAKALLSTIYKNQGKWVKSLEYLDSIYEVNPRALPKYLPPRAFVKAKLGDYKGAVQDLDQFLKKLGAANHDYDEVVRRAMEERTKYAEMIRPGATKTKTAQKSP